MISSATTPTRAQVAAHYDSLSDFYLGLWGEHVHHGLWRTGHESTEEATRALVQHVADLARVGPRSRVCDVGCGYGATARMLAKERGADVCGLTISAAQYAYAAARSADERGVRILLRDWMDNRQPDESFDAVLAIESSEHMADKRRFVGEAHRVLRPGGRFVVAAWLASESAGRLARAALLEPICSEGRLSSLATAGEYVAWMRDAGFVAVQVEDLTRAVRRTWSVCIARMLRAIASDPRARRFVLSRENDDHVFARTVVRMALAYAVGALRYGVFCAVKG